VRLSAIRLGVLLVPSCLAAAGAASAQPAAALPATRASQPAQLRSQISIMEGVLERAVGEGIRGAVSEMPDIFGPWIWGAPPRARGFKIDGYGVFFDVEVPELPASITWSLQVINRNNDVAVVDELNQLRLMIGNVSDPKTKADLMRVLSRVESHVSGAALSDSPVRVVNGQVVTAAPAKTPPPPSPGQVYTTAVKKALVNVMLEQGRDMMQIAPEDWFTIAACDSQGSGRIAPGEPELMTLYLSIRGRDLAALRAGQITLEEAAKRIVEKNY
jgi:hypothetical protein